MKYEGWKLIDTLPKGWTELKHTGSPISGAIFVFNQKPVWGGRETALLIVRPDMVDRELKRAKEKGRQVEI